LAWVADYIVRQFTWPKVVTRPTTNRAECRATTLIETNVLPLHSTAFTIVSIYPCQATLPFESAWICISTESSYSSFVLSLCWCLIWSATPGC